MRVKVATHETVYPTSCRSDYIVSLSSVVVRAETQNSRRAIAELRSAPELDEQPWDEATRVYRQTIGPPKDGLIGYLKEIPGLEVSKTDDPLTKQIASLEKEIDEFDSHKLKVSAAISVLENCHEQWLSLMTSLRGGEAKEEGRLYQQMADNPNGVLQVMDRAREACELVASREQKARLPQADPRNPRIVLGEVECILKQLYIVNEDTNHLMIELMVEQKLRKWILLEAYEKKSEDPSWNVDMLREYVEKLICLGILPRKHERKCSRITNCKALRLTKASNRNTSLNEHNDKEACKNGWMGLSKVVFNCVSPEQFFTTLGEVEAIINARPLTYVGKDLLQILRQIDFPSPTADIEAPTTEYDSGYEDHSSPQQSARDRLLQYWKRPLNYAESSRKLWYTKYVQILRERYTHNATTRRHAGIGEVVFVRIPRRQEECGKWKLLRSSNQPRWVQPQCALPSALYSVANQFLVFVRS
uniref:DUF5641 domain-containing protein n=1 Tax=Ascaris lumbricoides TaxID=6252 RepID=A0A9J2NRB9_ASCLU